MSSVSSTTSSLLTGPRRNPAASSNNPSSSSSSSSSAAAHRQRLSPPATQAITAHADLHATLPSAETQRHIAQARAAVVASMGNLLDSELQSRAQMLHDNATALRRQEADVLRAVEGLRCESAKLAGEADVAAARLKEVGNVQNWAEVLERGFLVLEETVRLANDGGSSCSCSECGDEEQPAQDDGDGQRRQHADAGGSVEARPSEAASAPAT